ncbi:MAG TPA: hypothetical protein VIL86_19235 [Tepidisphaeraceae bacterium]|jgi:phosphatidylglycerophosphate synthase
MTTYQPSSRRPIAALFRGTAARAVKICAAAGIHPDVISYASIAAAAGAAGCFLAARWWPAFLLLAPLLCYLRLWCNMLDGMVALASGKASLRGEILNDLPDRISDILIFAGVAHSGWCNPIIAYWAAMAALLTAYVGMLGQAVGARREFSGVMSKPWRMVALHLGAWIAAGLWYARGVRTIGFGWSVLDVACAIVIAGCIQTIWLRLARIMRALRAKTK